MTSSANSPLIALTSMCATPSGTKMIWSFVAGLNRRWERSLLYNEPFSSLATKGLSSSTVTTAASDPATIKPAHVYGLSSGASISYERSTTLAGKLIEAS